MRTSLLLATVSMLSWGVWAVFADFATRTLAPEVAMILSYVAGVAVAVGYLLVQPDPVSLTASGVGYALLGGVFSGVGAVAYYAALQSGNAAVATTITALYFVVAAALGVVVLGEPLALRDAAGIALAVAAVALLAT